METKTLITASNISSLVELLYVLIVDHLESGEGKAKPETALEVNSLARPVLSVWNSALPALKPALLAVLKGKDKASRLADLGVSIKALMPQARQDGSLKHEDLEVLNAVGAFFRTGSELALNKLQKLASVSGSPWVVQRLAPEVGDQQTTKEALISLVKGMVGRKDIALTIDEAKQVKELKPEQYKTYLRLRKDFNQAWKDGIVSYIRSSGKDMVPYPEVLKYLKLNGIDHMLPVGFTGLVDDRIRLYTNKGKMIDGIPNAVTFPIIKMNPDYGKPEGGDFVFQAFRAEGDSGPYFYTSDFKKEAARSKFSVVSTLSKKMEGMRKRWFQNVRKFDPEAPTSIASVVLELLYEFSARIGSVGNAANGQSTFGIGTLLVKHAIIDPAGNITLRYKGKDGVNTVHKLLKADPEQRFVVAALHTLLAGKEPKERIFTLLDKGKNRPIGGVVVNRYFKALGAGDATVHKIRTYHGTKLFQQLLEELEHKGKKPRNEKEAMAYFKKMAEEVGKKLNHVRRGANGTKVTGTTALQAYIDPVVQLSYFRNLGYRIPKFLEKFDTV